MIKLFVLLVFATSIVYLQFRGQVRHKWMKQIFDHSALLAPLNVGMYLFSGVSTRPYVPTSAFAGLDQLETHWEEIRAEALALAERIKAATQHDDAGFNSFFKEGWKRFYLKWYDDPPPSARHCPRTVELLRQTPCIKAALFAYLPAGAKLNPHRDPYAGSLRYHLGLRTPNDDRCRIWVDGQTYSWRDGQSVVFDETYIHWVRNDTDQDRLILLCDVERPMKYRWAQWINHAFSRYVMTAAASPNEVGDRVGLIGRFFHLAFVAGQYRRRFKRWNRPVYQATKFVLIVGVIAALVWL
ncbi:MAG: aspartyl/asparaginyl beta-hydroxylase domain-containing protein [Pseudomonadota bacterium]|nr:aspartyl/asparaginyl beta-hydroxylase domain-containing protein [Pseudomonadota bacterium]